MVNLGANEVKTGITLGAAEPVGAADHTFDVHVARLCDPDCSAALAYGFIGGGSEQAYCYSTIPDVQSLEHFGLTLDLAGISILSRFISSNQRYQTFCLTICEQFLWFVVSASVGLFLCNRLDRTVHPKLCLNHSLWEHLLSNVPVTFFVTISCLDPEGKLRWSEERA